MRPYAYDAEYYDRGIRGFHAASYPVISSTFETYLGNETRERILDFGCGSGFWGSFLSKHCRNLAGVDFSEALRTSNHRSIYQEFDQIDLGKAWDSPTKHDVVFSIEVIEHVENSRQFLGNAFNALLPGGRLFLTTTTYFWSIFILLIVYRRQTTFAALLEFILGLLGNEEKRSMFVRRFWDYFTGHYHGFSPRRLRRLLDDAGFQDIRIEYLQIQPVVPVDYLSQHYGGPHPRIVKTLLPVIRVGGRLVNWVCRTFNIYAPNVLVRARRPFKIECFRPRTETVFCIDSPGLGGAEKTLMRLLGWIGSEGVRVIHTDKVSPQVRKFLVARGIPNDATLVSGNRVSSAPRAIWRALKIIFTHPRALFVLWSHHHDSNRWLQLVLALFRRRFLLVERLVAAQRSDFARSRLSIPLKRFVASRATAIVLNAHSQVEHYRDLFELPNVPIVVIPNSRPINSINERVHQLRMDRVALRRSLQLSDSPIILCVGRLEAQKDQATLIRALAQLTSQPEAQLVLVGDGPDRKTLETLAAGLAPAQVTFTGYQPDPLPWLAVADLFVLPSLFEGLPGALVEAMAAELPCIATDIPGNRELVVGGQTGVLVERGVPTSLARAIDGLLTDKVTASHFAAEALEQAQNRYSEEIESEKWRNFFASNSTVSPSDPVFPLT
jgi:glycosyltransferase involved in cell wall biosynthesis